jgi:hypothetical protein
VTLPVGTTTVTLTVSDGLDSDTDTMTVTVYPPITATGVDVSSMEGLQFQGAVATFTDPDPNGAPGEYATRIDWGDGTPTTEGTVTKSPDGVLTVSDDHVYIEEGHFPITVTIMDPSNPFNRDVATPTATVVDAPLYATGLDLLSTNPFSGVVANFTDANPYAPLSDFTATIDWGDGTASTAGTVTGQTGGPFSVSGSHEYETLGPKTITVHILDEGGSTATATTSLLLYALSGGGNFVIGDENDTIGNQVTYWGAQWWTTNQLTGGTAPAAFKGYANSPADVLPTTNWTTDPGNSASPPASVPSYMAVIVGSAIAKDGSTISGDAPHVVIVRTDAGYDANPGHAGTGTVVAVLR